MLKVAAFFDLGACTIAVGVYPGTLFREAYSHSERCSGKLIPIANAVPGSLFPQRTLFREAYSQNRYAFVWQWTQSLLECLEANWLIGFRF